MCPRSPQRCAHPVRADHQGTRPGPAGPGRGGQRRRGPARLRRHRSRRAGTGGRGGDPAGHGAAGRARPVATVRRTGDRDRCVGRRADRGDPPRRSNRSPSGRPRTAPTSPLETLLTGEEPLDFAPPRTGSYEPLDPPQLPLVDEEMKATICVSPEAGWGELEIVPRRHPEAAHGRHVPVHRAAHLPGRPGCRRRPRGDGSSWCCTRSPRSRRNPG